MPAVQSTDRASDLLCRIHEDLAGRMSAMHLDLRRFMGVLVPDMEQALAQQVQREYFQSEVPPDIEDGFQRAWVADRPNDAFEPSLQEIADAFVIHYHKSTIEFTAGILVENRVPELGQYISLLKCVWLMRRIRGSTEFAQQGQTLSHWPSYIQELEDVSRVFSLMLPWIVLICARVLRRNAIDSSKSSCHQV